jgi:membrane dipeptidase
MRAKLEELQRLYANDPDKLREERRKLFGEGRADRPKATLDDLVAHIDHVVKLVGVDYVGLGSDFDGVSAVPEGMEDISKLPNLTRALLERGYSAADIRKIYGGNLLRVMRQVEKVSAAGGAGGRSPATGKSAGK